MASSFSSAIAWARRALRGPGPVASSPSVPTSPLGASDVSIGLDELRAGIVNAMRSSDRLTVLLHELAEGRADNRESLSAMLTLLSAMGALFGVVFYVIFGTKTAYASIPTPVWAFLPAIPFGLTGFLIYVGTQSSLRDRKSVV